MSARETDTRRRVEQYVQRQKAYIPTYTSERLVDQRAGTPPRSDAFGFDTPVLRPRVPVKKTSQPQLTPKAGPSTSRAHEVESRREATQNAISSKPQPKRQQDPDNERAARLADRRARKRKKRAIVNPPRNRDDESDTVPTADPKKGGKVKKVKKPAALALLYGFSATNVTKDRLTLKPTPSLGVFSKGKASAKKKVTAASMFSETEFLNKTREQAVGHSKTDVDSDDNSVSSISKPRGRTTNRTRKDRDETAPKPPQAPTAPTAESKVWDIELQSKLPSSARDASSEPGANDSAPIVLDPRGATWSASLDMAVEHDSNKDRTRSLSVMHHSEVCSPLARSDLHDELGIPHTEAATSIHPSHSVSQVGHRAADALPPEQQQMTSKYFTAPTPVSVQEYATISMPTSRSHDGFDVCDDRTPDQDIQCTVPHVRGMVSPIPSVSSAAQPMPEFQTWHDVAPLVFSSDYASDDDCYARAHVPLEPLGVGGCFTTSVVEQSIGAHEDDAYDLQQGALYSMSTGLGDGDVGMEYFEGAFDPLAAECEDDLDELGVHDPGEEWCQDCAVYEDESMCGDEEGVPQFFEGRALLLGVPEWSGNEVLSGLAQAEMDVARRLGDHWRPQRL